MFIVGYFTQTILTVRGQKSDMEQLDYWIKSWWSPLNQIALIVLVAAVAI